MSDFEPENQTDSNNSKDEIRKTKKVVTPRPFPTNSIAEAIEVPIALKEKNGGNPWMPTEVAKAIGMGKGNKFYSLTTSSRDYGFTKGTQNTDKIELDEIGKSIVYAKSKTEKAEGYRSAFYNIPLFKKVFDYYKGSSLPELEFLKNTLITEFDIKEEFHEDFVKIYKENILLLQKEEPNSTDINIAEIKTDQETTPHSIILGSPDKGSSKIIFVVMPFSEKTEQYPDGFFNEVLKQLITPAGVKAGFKVETANKKGSDIIQSTIVNDLTKADLVIADLTEHNPNVLFELGWRIAHDKPVALIRAKGTKAIFDVDHMLRVFDYNPNLWRSTLENDIPNLCEHIKATWEARNNEKTYKKILTES